MNKIKLNYLVDLSLFLILVANTVSILLHSRRLHTESGIIFLFLIIIHLTLHRQWLITTTKNIFKKNRKLINS